ncbi:MAG: hypothetical protein ACM3OO_07485, partial [Planctomycetaceae bacterium]
MAADVAVVQGHMSRGLGADLSLSRACAVELVAALRVVHRLDAFALVHPIDGVPEGEAVADG